MFSYFNHNLEYISFTSCADISSILIGIMDLSDFLSLNEIYFNFSQNTINECNNCSGNMRRNLDSYDDYYFTILNYINVGDIYGQRDKFALYIKKEFLLVVIIHDEDRSIETLLKKSMQNCNTNTVNITKIIYLFLDQLLYRDSSIIEDIELQLTRMEENLVNNNNNCNLNTYLFSMKKELFVLKNYYEQLIDLGESLQNNKNEILDNPNLKYFDLYIEKCKRLSFSVLSIKDSIFHLREAYDASLEYNLNNIMKIFTVITSIFLPLNLIVGWYGMNFKHMPELSWRYGYVCLIIISLLVIIFNIYYYKKKKLF